MRSRLKNKKYVLDGKLMMMSDAGRLFQMATTPEGSHTSSEKFFSFFFKENTSAKAWENKDRKWKEIKFFS